MNDRIEITIERLGHQGDGIASGPYFAPLTLPGERISGKLEDRKLTDIKILEPSPLRVAASCKHYRSCGGCALQHIKDDFVASWKLDVVKAALAAKGLTSEFRPIETSLEHSRRRATFSAKRTKKGVLTGFHARASETIIAIEDCAVVSPDILAILPKLDALALIGASRKGELTIQVTKSTAGLDVAVTEGKPIDTAMQVELAALAEAAGLARLSWNGDVVVARHNPYQSMGDARVTPPPGAFLQATEHGEQVLVTAVKEIVGSAKRIVDLFSGCGTFSLPLAKTAEIHAVEGDPAMISALDKAWRETVGLKKLSSESRDLFRRPLMPDELNRFEAAIIDPPRAGAEAQIEHIAASALTRLAMVSCNPVTFARDAAVLVSAGFSLDWVQTVDQFRWSTHVELVASFTRL
ncbi:MAG TPA: class I SAM-dependent RNA methyltransferase [Rhodobacteraceae bacterium]|jgi:23S rRNA (uracil1939-C5)-methyltransferase|nr:class I SAM-dependent RNA methyltransferase [Paracoccaceae bacterium]